MGLKRGGACVASGRVAISIWEIVWNAQQFRPTVAQRKICVGIVVRFALRSRSHSPIRPTNSAFIRVGGENFCYWPQSTRAPDSLMTFAHLVTSTLM